MPINRKLHIILRILFFMLVISVTVIGLQIQQIGTVEESLFAPTSLHVSMDNLAVLEPYTKQLKIFRPGGVIQKSINLKGETNGLSQLSESVYLFCDRVSQEVIAVDITKETQHNLFENIFAFSNPTDILVYNDKIHILDADLKMIVVFDKNLTHLKDIPIINNAQESIHFAGSFGLNKTNQNYYIFDQVTSTVWVLDSNGKFVKTFGSFGAGHGQISRGGELIINENGFVFISDRYQNRVSIFSEDGEFVDYINVLDSLQSKLSIPTGMAVDENGILYVASTESSKIHIFHIEKVTSRQSMSIAQQLYPFESDTVNINDLKLVANAELIENSLPVLGFDFQIFDEADHTDPIKEVNAIEPTVTTDSETNRRIITAEWTIDHNLQHENRYSWRTRIRYTDTLGEWTDFRTFITSPLPLKFELKQNYPNPFNPETNIAFTIPEEEKVTLEIINLLGQKINTLLDERVPAGHHVISWNGRDDYGSKAATGVYFYRLTAGEYQQSKKMVLIK